MQPAARNRSLCATSFTLRLAFILIAVGLSTSGFATTTTPAAATGDGFAAALAGAKTSATQWQADAVLVRASATVGGDASIRVGAPMLGGQPPACFNSSPGALTVRRWPSSALITGRLVNGKWSGG
jgi:hypothetical protein